MRVSELIRLAEREGWSARVRHGGHLELTHPDASASVFTSVSPSDGRWWRNTLAQMRRVLPPQIPEPAAAEPPAKPKKAKRRPPRKREREVRITHEPAKYVQPPPAPDREPRPYDPSLCHRRIPGAPYGYAKARW